MGYISLNNLVKEYLQGDNVVYALNQVNLEIFKGEFLVILGPSGSGKTTLLNVVGGLDQVTSGKILVDGMEISHLSEDELAGYRRKMIGFVFQSFNLLPTLTVEENIIMPILLDKKQVDLKFVHELMEELEINQLYDRMPSQISGGQQQRVAIARALANNPQIILADEPTGNLDSTISKKVINLLVSLCRKYGKTLIMITHNKEIASYADRVVEIRDGKEIVNFS